MSKVALDFNQPVPPAVEEDELTLAAIERGVRDANQGRTVSMDEVRKLIPE